MRKMYGKMVFSVILFITGALFFYSNTVGISAPSVVEKDENKAVVYFDVMSKKEKPLNLEFAIPNYYVVSIQCNNHHFEIFRTPENYKFLPASYTGIKVSKGINKCTGYLLRKDMWKYLEDDPALEKLNIVQKPLFYDFLIYLFLMGGPLLYMIAYFGSILVKKVSDEANFNKKNLPRTKEKEKRSKILLGILFLGIIIRLAYYDKFGSYFLQHDWGAHIELFQTILNNQWTLPMPSTGLEFPQQPLYYLISAGIYTLTDGRVEDPLMWIGGFSLLSSIVFLVYVYKLSFILNLNHVGKIVFLSFFALLPTMVYISARINNDALVLPLMAMAIYYIIKSYQADFKRHFWKALVVTSLLFLTKLSASPIELFFFFLILDRLFTGKDPENARSALMWFALVGASLISIALFRDWQPIENSFRFINSAAYPNQTIENITLSYFIGFPYGELLSAKQCFVFGNDPVRHHLLSYLYGTMFVGEFNYQTMHYSGSISSMLSSYSIFMQYLFGLSIPIAIATFIATLKKRTFMEWLMLALVGYTLALVIVLFLKYPSICNTDFRYLEISYIFIGYIIAAGIQTLRKSKGIVKLLGNISMVSFFITMFWGIVLLLVLIFSVSNI